MLPVILRDTTCTDCNTTIVVEEVNKTVTSDAIDNIAAELAKLQNLANLCITCNMGLNAVSAAFLWTVALLFMICSIILLFLTTRRKPGHRVSFITFFFVHNVFFIVYILMALSHGRLYQPLIQLVTSAGNIVPQVVHVPVEPPQFYARFIAWGIGHSMILWLFISHLAQAATDVTLLAMIINAAVDMALLVGGIGVGLFWVLWLVSMGFMTILVLLILWQIQPAVLAKQQQNQQNQQQQQQQQQHQQHQLSPATSSDGKGSSPIPLDIPIGEREVAFFRLRTPVLCMIIGAPVVWILAEGIGEMDADSQTLF